MRLKLKFAVAFLGGVLLVAMFAQSAFAASAQQWVALHVGDSAGSGYSAAYGNEVDLNPTVLSAMELPNDQFTFQAYTTDSDAVQKWLDITSFEPIQLEDTNTVSPLGFQMGYDNIQVSQTDFTPVTLTYPIMIRCVYKPNKADTAPISTSETETVRIDRNDSEHVMLTASRVVRHAGTKFNFQVSPNAGVGTVRVTVKKAGATMLTYTVATDADGHAATTLKLGSKHGAYRVSAKFLGNQWGVASPWTRAHTLVAKH